MDSFYASLWTRCVVQQLRHRKTTLVFQIRVPNRTHSVGILLPKFVHVNYAHDSALEYLVKKELYFE